MRQPSPECVQSRVFLILPSYNEGRVLASTIRGLLPYGYSIVVVDDGSSDGTAAILEGLPVHYLRHPINLGQGAALQTGMITRWLKEPSTSSTSMPAANIRVTEFPACSILSAADSATLRSGRDF